MNGRAVRPDWRRERFRASVEVGRRYDVAAWMQVGRSRFGRPEHAVEVQQWLASRIGAKPSGVQAELGRRGRYSLVSDSAPGEIGVLDSVVYDDLVAVGRLAGDSKPPPRSISDT